ncbi:ATP-dependent DNA helicase [Alteracholeplasma palmae J233]|uniref:ATP-dependent DNA helicase n=1 Tax=Alteracholeplasma palmae (strain ATCC 49389 / J233) TaxID=1318466 RepID=U4KS70_ALTPJ|nr:ATP-dependent DNA helicase RecG [Alteracholeplasma palmae]CCV64776.1 ATP-dependent DNA helicase [Alteracholeplasma palmae J233]
MKVSLEEIKNIGPKTLYQLRQNNIWSTYDLILTRPKRYENYILSSIETVSNNEVITIYANIHSEIKNFKKNVLMTNFKVKVGEKVIDVITFNKPFLQKNLKLSQLVLIKGKYDLYKNKILAESVLTKLDTPPLKPIYKIGDIKDAKIYQLISQIFKENKVDIFEVLPEPILQKYHFYRRSEAYYKLHQPQNKEELNQAINRLKYEEAYLQQKKFKQEQNELIKKVPISYKLDLVKEYIKKIPYELTKDQKDAVNDIFRDFKSDIKHERLIQGDVGSGKTVVAFIAALGAITAHKQVALMAPTEILAKQHYDNFSKLYPEVKSCLFTSKTKNKQEILEKINHNETSMIIGTHALSSEYVNYYDLGLVIIDEQHKFGVKTKEDLKDKIASDVIYLTATPIPRTLLLAYFGDLEVSVIKEKPSKRKDVLTSIIEYEQIKELLKENQNKNEQSFIIVPAITSDKKDYNIEMVSDALKDFSHLYILHGKQSASEQELMMESFSKNNKGILLATQMVEVGIDVKNATKIFILGANYFGLSQLHQLRGRVGRSDKLSYCYLIANDADNERLEVLTHENDGFKLSQFDLKTRGPGEFFGKIQSGYLKYHFLNLETDLNILIQARKDVEKYI